MGEVGVGGKVEAVGADQVGDQRNGHLDGKIDKFYNLNDRF